MTASTVWASLRPSRAGVAGDERRAALDLLDRGLVLDRRAVDRLDGRGRPAQPGFDIAYHLAALGLTLSTCYDQVKRSTKASLPLGSTPSQAANLSHMVNTVTARPSIA
jgi:hypothetical protein